MTTNDDGGYHDYDDNDQDDDYGRGGAKAGGISVSSRANNCFR